MTHEEILALIAHEVGLPPEGLDPHVPLATLNISSLDLVSLLFELEDRCGIVIQPEEVPPESTLQQLIDRISPAASA